MEKKRILIAVPCYSYAQAQTMQSIYDMEVPDGYETRLQFQQGYTVAQARNLLVEHSLKEGYDYTLFVDSDIILPKGILSSLLAADSPMATGWYVKKMDGEGITELYNPVPGNGQLGNVMEKDMPKEGLYGVEACGFGCILVKNDVFRAVGSACWFEYIEKPGVTCSEDITFCIKARNLKFTIMADASIRCGHIGQRVF